MTTAIWRRLRALERSPRLQEPARMSLEELLTEVAHLVGEHDPAAAQRLRGCGSSGALGYACDLLGELAESEDGFLARVHAWAEAGASPGQRCACIVVSEHDLKL